MLTYVGWMRWRFPGGDLSNNFMYVLPIMVPFVAFLFDRAEQFHELQLFELTVDILVIAVSIMRSFGLVPLVSGHVLFLTYAIARPGSALTRISALIVIFQVLYLKILIWHDPITPIFGLVLGVLAGLIVRSARARLIPRSLTPLKNSK